jgi:TonB family protein
MSSLPVADTSLSGGTGSVTLPHFADGGGWVTQIILVNPGDSPISGTARLVGSSGESLDTFPFLIPRHGSFKQPTPGTGAAVRSGSIQITPNVDNPAPVSVAIFSYRPANVTISEAAVVPVSGTALRMYSEAAGAAGSALSKQSGIAVTNLSASPATVTFEQSGLDGSAIASASIVIPGNGQISKFLRDVFASLPSSLQGVLRISAPQPGVSVVGLRGRYNERGEFLITTTPPASETAPTSLISSYVFPEVANGGGYTTQFLLFSRSGGQPTNARVVFANYDGTLPLNLNCPALNGGTGSTFAEVLRRVLPQYTDAGRQARITGPVIMQGVVHEDGSISVSRFIQTLGYGLDENSQSAIEQWRFCPATSNGRAVASTITITVTFTIV